LFEKESPPIAIEVRVEEVDEKGRKKIGKKRETLNPTLNTSVFANFVVNLLNESVDGKASLEIIEKKA